MTAQEIWRDAAGFEGRYEVSSAGNVRNVKTGRVLKLNRCSNGYLAVSLGRANPVLVHRLVAKAFVDGDSSLQVNHRNGVRDDNCADNLEWVTCGDNHRHSYQYLNRKKHSKTQPVTVGGVAYESQLAAARALGVSPASIHSAFVRGHKCRGMEVTT